MNKWQVVGVVIFGIVAATIATIFLRPVDDAGYIKLVENYLAGNSNLDEEDKVNLREVLQIMKSNPGFSDDTAENLIGNNCIGSIKSLRESINENKKSGVGTYGMLASMQCKDAISNHAKAAKVAEFNKEVQDLVNSAEEVGLIRNNKNVIPKVGSSCPSGYEVDGNYCQQR